MLKIHPLHLLLCIAAIWPNAARCDLFISDEQIAAVVNEVQSGQCDVTCSLGESRLSRFNAERISGPHGAQQWHVYLIKEGGCGSAGCGSTLIAFNNTEVRVIENTFGLDPGAVQMPDFSRPESIAALKTIHMPLNFKTDWTSVQNQIIFQKAYLGLEPAFSVTEQDLILEELKRVFNASEEARATMLDYVSEERKLEIVPRSAIGSEQPNIDSNQININLNDVSNSYLSLDGQVIQLSLGTILYHEFLHVYDRTVGNTAPEREKISLTEIPYSDPEFDHFGSVVRRVNAVRADLGEKQRGSYTGLNTIGWGRNPKIHTQTHIESLGALISGSYDQVILFYAGDDVSKRQIFSSEVYVDGRGTRDLVIALNMLNDIYTGDGNDTIVGYVGNDLISAGRGDDRIMGREGDDVIDGGGGSHDMAVFTGAMADYNITRGTDGRIVIEHARGVKSDGTDTLSGVEFAEFVNANMDLSLVRHVPIQSEAWVYSGKPDIILVPGNNHSGISLNQDGSANFAGQSLFAKWQFPKTARLHLYPSPNGASMIIVYSDLNWGGVRAAIIDLRGSKIIEKQLISDQFHILESVAWSPEGRLVALRRAPVRGWKSDLALVDVAEGKLTIHGLDNLNSTESADPNIESIRWISEQQVSITFDIYVFPDPCNGANCYPSKARTVAELITLSSSLESPIGGL